MGKKTIKINVPENMDEVSVEKYMEYLEAVEGKEKDIEVYGRLALRVFCGIDDELEKKMPKKERDKIAVILMGLVNKSYPLVKRFEVDGVEYGFHPNLDGMSLAEFVDADQYSGGWENVARFLAVLYRPIIKSRGDRYEIDIYKGSGELEGVMKKQPASLYLGVSSFFLRLGIGLMNYTLNSMNNEKYQRMMNETLAKSGGGLG